MIAVRDDLIAVREYGVALLLALGVHALVVASLWVGWQPDIESSTVVKPQLVIAELIVLQPPKPKPRPRVQPKPVTAAKPEPKPEPKPELEPQSREDLQARERAAQLAAERARQDSPLVSRWVETMMASSPISSRTNCMASAVVGAENVFSRMAGA